MQDLIKTKLLACNVLNLKRLPPEFEAYPVRGRQVIPCTTGRCLVLVVAVPSLISGVLFT